MSDCKLAALLHEFISSEVNKFLSSSVPEFMARSEAYGPLAAALEARLHDRIPKLIDIVRGVPSDDSVDAPGPETPAEKTEHKTKMTVYAPFHGVRLLPWR